ncbi:MAG: phosphatidylglycerophosphatase A [Candidatus Omnitrophota bacterium]|nr:phosphatidylglycerophosphatase A [Candidatus Omnitrophota bacterium]
MRLSKNIVQIISTFFYIGYLPLIPGTFGSLAGLILFCFIKDSSGLSVLVTIVLLILGFLSCGKIERLYNIKDPRFVVCDEVCGMFISLLFLPFYNTAVFITAFFVFRLFDTLKPYPASKFQKLKGSLGIMSDDIIAGLYTNIVIQIVFRIISFKVS